MRTHFAPLFWLCVGLLGAASHAYAGSRRFLTRRSPERLAELQRAYSSSYTDLLPALAALYCAYAAISGLVSNGQTWWIAPELLAHPAG